MIRREEHYGAKVWTETVMDELRKARCLCLQCHHLGECDAAKAMYAICKENDMAMATTRCKMFDSDAKIESVIDNPEGATKHGL